MMDEVGDQGRRVCRGAAKATRREFLAVASAVGADLAVGSAGSPALAEPASERP
jgi:hypothetical protein